MTFDIITFGSAVIDCFIETGVPELNKKMCYPVGTKIAVDKAYFSTGGGGTNTAVAFSRMGLKTGFIGKVGRDGNGESILLELKKEKIKFLGSRSDEHTGFSVILDSKEHQRTVLTYKGATDTIKLSEIKLKKVKTDWLYLSSLAGEAHKTQEQLINLASQKNTKIAFNPSSYLTKKGVKYLKKIIEKVNILILNDEEAADLIKAKNKFAGLHALGPEIVCITYGKKGSEVSDKKNIFKIRPHKVKIAEVTGAGDAYASAFIVGLIKLKDIKKAAQLATLNAESVIQIPGAKNGLLKWTDAENLLKNALV